VLMQVTTGSPWVFQTLVTNAVRAFKSGIVVSAASQPYIAPGTTGAAGNITIAETANGQLSTYDYIQCQIVSTASDRNQQIYLSTANSNDLPVVSTNSSSGLVAQLGGTWSGGFWLWVSQQAVAPNLGVITISNLHYTVASGTATGPVNVECSGGNKLTSSILNIQPENYYLGSSHPKQPVNGGPGWACVTTSGTALSRDWAAISFEQPNEEWAYLDYPGYYCDYASTPGTQMWDVYLSRTTYVGESVTQFGGQGAFDQFVSNAIVGTAPVPAAKPALSIGAYSALGLRPTSGYTTKSLKIQTKGQYVTWKFTGGAALAGQRVVILVVKGVGGVWGAWNPLTVRIADANGIVTYYYKSTTAGSISVRAEWMGSATYGDSLSPARGVTWK